MWGSKEKDWWGGREKKRERKKERKKREREICRLRGMGRVRQRKGASVIE